MRTPTTSAAWRLPHRVRVSGGEVATDVLGDGPPVVLVHGPPAWSFLWREVAPLLAHRYTVHVWDLLDAAVLGPWNTPFTEHMQQHADAYRTMPPHVFADIIAPRLRTATHHPMSEAVADAYLAPWAGEAGQGRWVDQVASVSFEDTREAVDRLDRVTAPTLVLWGAQDQWLAPTVGDRLAAAIPGAQRETVADAGHFLAEDNPQDTADALLRFLDS